MNNDPWADFDKKVKREIFASCARAKFEIRDAQVLNMECFGLIKIAIMASFVAQIAAEYQNDMKLIWKS